MRNFTSILILLFCTLFFSAPAGAWLFGKDDTLVSIDGTRYSGNDFKQWWALWKEEKSSFPKTPDVYIDWLLLTREGERMDLASDPGFRRQSEVFIKSRALLMLKYDEVNSQIAVSEADVQAHYEREYLPRWLVQRLEFKDESAATDALQAISEGSVTADELIARSSEQGGPVLHRENWLRPKGLDRGWADIFRNLTVGALVDPGEYGRGPTLFYLKEQKGGDEEDLAGLRDGIRREVWKEQENARTAALLKTLSEKYQVVVDEERIDALDLTAAEETFTDAIVIATNKQSVSEKDFLVIARRHLNTRPTAVHGFADAEGTRKIKSEIVGGIIAQNITDWEALDRHYEEREPFKWEYDFHVRHRLLSALEERLFLPRAVVTEDDLKRHYEENISRYTQPAMVKLFIIDDTQGPVEQVRADVLVGVPFAKALKDRFEKSVSSQEIPADHLDPEVKKVVDKLTIGETSQLFSAQGSKVIVHLLERTPASPLPLERVANSVRPRLVREKIDQQRSEYLETLKSRSRIKVRKQQWKAIQKEFGGA